MDLWLFETETLFQMHFDACAVRDGVSKDARNVAQVMIDAIDRELRTRGAVSNNS